MAEIYGRHIVYSDSGTWYPEACSSLGLEHQLHSSYEKSIIERVVQSLNDRTEGFDDYYPCMNCELEHVYKWTRVICFHVQCRTSTHQI